jgi:hypothetical protein
MPNCKQRNSCIGLAYHRIAALCVVLYGAMIVATQAAPTFASGSSQVHLIELYTSEGCSSCPPADRWLGTLQADPLLWSRIVPVAFHVDYWDYLGWRDDYARAEYSQRQQRYARLLQAPTVYTPGMFLNGQEWREWQSSSALKGSRATDASPTGQLTLNYDRARSTLSFVTAAATQPAAAKAYMALLGVNIDSPIKAGENKGKRLRHDFVVLELVSTSLMRGSQGLEATFPAITTKLTAPKYAVAAWVTNSNDSRPLQATGGWLPAQ